MKTTCAWIACLLLTSALARAQAVAPPAAPAAPPALEVLSVVPASGGTLRPMEKAVVAIRYVGPAGAEFHIWAQPMWKGIHIRDGFFEASGILSGSGELTRYVSSQSPAQLDGVDVQMVDATTKKVLAQLDHPVELQWVGAAANSKQVAAAEEQASPLLGKPFPPLAFTGLQGESVDLAALKGKVVLVDFWATWCGPCRGEMPNLIAAYKKHHAAGFEIVAISLDRDKAKLEAYLAENGMTWPQFFDGQGWKNEIAAKFDIHSIPASFLLDREGVVRHSKLRGPDMEPAIAELLK